MSAPVVNGRASAGKKKTGKTMGTAMKLRHKTPIFGGALAAVAALALSGCISLAPKPPELLFRLTPQDKAPAGSQATGGLPMPSSCWTLRRIAASMCCGFP